MSKENTPNLPFLAVGNEISEEDKKREMMQAQKLRRKLTLYSALLMVAVPTLLVIIYYGFFASDKYAVEARYSIRSINSSGSNDLLGMVTGMPSQGSTVTDSHILMDYIHSMEILAELGKRINIREMFSFDKADMLSGIDPSTPLEDYVEYWRDMITVNFDSSSQIIVMEVKAFTSKDAKLIADAVLELSEKTVNNLSGRARKDAVHHAELEVERMEERLRQHRTTVRTFREKGQDIDPAKTAEAKLTLIANLEGQVSTAKAKLASLKNFMDDDSPRIIVLRSTISALEKQLTLERKGLGKGNRETVNGGAKTIGSLSGRLNLYESIRMDQEFAEKAYLSAMGSLERARMEADRQQRYLAVFVNPRLPEVAIYPRRGTNMVMFFAIFSIFWMLTILIVYAVRDHSI